MSDHIFEMENISKEFPGVRALDSVNFRVKKGEIHALVGENGAGKSTLMKILSGLHPAGSYEGKIIIKGSERHFHTIKDSEHAGVVVIYQELALVRQLSICENIFLGAEKARGGIINWDMALVEAKKWLDEVGLTTDPMELVANIGVGKQQLVEIAKALAKNAEILILDEPTAALNEEDSKHLLNILRKLKSKGVTCIYISHKLEEVLSIADSVTVLRDGRTIKSQEMQEDGGMTEAKMIGLMVGRTLEQRYPRKPHRPGDVVMDVRNWNVWHPEQTEKKVIKDLSFQVRKGEILGIAGLMGAGRTELFMSLFGAYGSKREGEVLIHGRHVQIGEPRHAIQHGLSYLSEDRKGNGLVLGMDILSNITMASLQKVSSQHGTLERMDRQLTKAGIINILQEVVVSNQYVKQLSIKTPSIEQKVKNLSGGNQQKVVIGKWLTADTEILIFDEPTRGIDVGAKSEIYHLLNDLARQGKSIIMISSELPEVLRMSHRILVMCEGRITGELDHSEATQEKIMSFATERGGLI
jgi:ABC-type sugar transport system ATPase subunit